MVIDSINFTFFYLTFLIKIWIYCKALAAIGLWNNMLEPVGRKSTSMNLNENIKCPSRAHPYFYTNYNSLSTYIQRYDYKRK